MEEGVDFEWEVVSLSEQYCEIKLVFLDPYSIGVYDTKEEVQVKFNKFLITS